MKFDDDYEKLEERDCASDADWRSMAAADMALEAWGRLPISRRHDPFDLAAQALFDAAFNVLSTPQAKQELAQRGAEAALRRDDAQALSGFMALGAAFPAPELQADTDDCHAYGDFWKQSIVHECATRGLHQCLRLFMDSGLVARDCALADPLLREPQSSPLRQIDRALLEQAAKLSKREPCELEDQGNDLILGLVGAMVDESESLSSSIAVAEARQHHPVFRLLAGDLERRRLQSPKGAAPSAAPTPIDELALDMARQGFFNSQLASHRGAALSLAAEGSLAACRMLVEAGLDVGAGASEQRREFEKLLCNPRGLAGLSPDQQALCAPWVAAPGFGSTLFEKAFDLAKRAAQGHSADAAGKGRDGQWRAARRLRRLEALAKASLDPQRGFDAPSPSSLGAVQAWVDASLLDGSIPKSSNELRAQFEALGKTLGSMRLPKRPALRV